MPKFDSILSFRAADLSTPPSPKTLDIIAFVCKSFTLFRKFGFRPFSSSEFSVTFNIFTSIFIGAAFSSLPNFFPSSFGCLSESEQSCHVFFENRVNQENIAFYFVSKQTEKLLPFSSSAHLFAFVPCCHGFNVSLIISLL